MRRFLRLLGALFAIAAAAEVSRGFGLTRVAPHVVRILLTHGAERLKLALLVFARADHRTLMRRTLMRRALSRVSLNSSLSLDTHSSVSSLSAQADTTAAVVPSLPLTVVLHGLAGACSPTRLLTLALQQRGFDAITLDYPARGQGIRENAEHVAAQLVERGLARRPLFLVGHSLGGIIAREVSREPGLNVSRIVTLGTPHTGAVAVERLRMLAPRLRSLGDVIHASLGASGKQLEPEHIEEHVHIPTSDVPVMGVAAVLREPLSGPSAMLMFDAGEEHDGRVRVEEATPTWLAECHIVRDCSHGLLPIHPDALAHIEKFLLTEPHQLIDISNS